MKSEWRISSNYISDEKQYIVYRIIDTNQIDHSGNREYSGGYMPCKEDAQVLTRKLNEVV